MAWTFNGVGSEASIANHSSQDVTQSDWAFCGWVRIPDNTGTGAARYLFERNTSGSPVLLLAYSEATAGSNPDHFYAKYRDDGTLNTDFFELTTFNISDYPGQWIPICLTHDGDNDTTYLRCTDIVTGNHFSANVVQAVGTHTRVTDFYFGAIGGGSNSRRLKGDMADWAFFDGLYMDVPQWEAWVRSGQSWRHPECSWHVPMLGDHEDEWVNQAAVSTTNLTSVYDGPPIQLHMPRGITDPSEAETPQGVKVAQHYLQTVATRDQSGAHVRVRRLYAEVLLGKPRAALEESVTSNLALTDSVQSSEVAGGTSNLNLIQYVNVFNYVADRSPAEHTLNLVQTVQTLSALGVSHSLNLSQTVSYTAPTYLSITQSLILTSKTSTPHRQWISQDLGISHLLNTPLPTQHLNHTLTLTHDSPIGRFEDTLNLTHSVWFAFSYEATSTLNLTHSVQMNADWVRSVEHTDFIGHALTWYEDTPCGQKQYTPFQGESTIPNSVVTPPEEDLQDPQGDTENFSLRIPYLGIPTSQVILRNPEMDNRDRNAYTRINNETRGGKVIVYADPNWPKIRTLAVTFVGLTETQVDELQTFMQATLGQEIGLTDWEGRLWKGFITNPNEIAVQDGKEKWVVTFEFEGEMLDVQQPDGNDGQSLNLTQTVTAVIE